MKHIDFIDEDLEYGFCVSCDGKTVDLTEKIRECDHRLEVRPGCPNDILSCAKCGWWKFVRVIPGHMMEQYDIKDLRSES